MTTTKLTRRTAMLGTVTLPAALAPLGLAQGATTGNATDAVWPAYLAAQGKVNALNATAGDATDEEIDAVRDVYDPAVDAFLDAQVATMTDVERKLGVILDCKEGNVMEPELFRDMLSQVEAATGRVA